MPPQSQPSPAEHSTPHPLMQTSVPQAASNDVTLPDAPDASDVPDVSEDSDGNPKTKTDSGSGSLMHDAKRWFDNANNNRNNTYQTQNDDGSPYFQKRDSSGDEANHDVTLMSPQHPPPFVPPGASFMPPNLGPHALTTPRSSSADDYRSVIDDLTIENKRLKEELKRYRQSINRDVLEKEKLFEIKVHGLPRRKKQELEATLRDFAASLGDSPSSEGASQRKREKSSVSSKERSSNHHHALSQNHSHNPAQYSSGGSWSKHASNSSSRSRPVDSAYASMSTGAQSSGPSLARQPFGGSKARASSEQKVARYLEDIPQGLHPNYGLRTLGDKDKKKLIVRRLEQLFTGKIGGRFARQGHSLIADQANQVGAASNSVTNAALNKFQPGPAAVASSAPKAGKSGSGGSKGSGDGDGGSGSGPAEHASAPDMLTRPPKALAGAGPIPAKTPVAPAPTSRKDILGSSSVPSAVHAEPIREARIQSRHGGHKNPRSQDNGSTSHSNSNGDDTANGSGNGNGNGAGNANNGSGAGTGNTSGNGSGNTSNATSGNGTGKSPPGSSLPEQRPTRPLDLDPDRVQVPSENMEYIRHLGLVPPEIGPRSIATTIDVSPDANGWVYLNLLSNLAQLHIFNVAPDFIRQAVVEKSTKFQLSPDGQKIRWRGGTDGTKFSSDGSSGDLSQQSTSTDGGDGSDEVGHRKRTKMSGHGGSVSGMSSGKKRFKNGMQHSGASSSFHYKPLFVRQTSSPMMSSEDRSTQDSDMLDVSTAGDKSKGKSKTKSSTNVIMNMANRHHSMSMTNSNSNIDISRYGHGHGHGHGHGYEMSWSGSSNNRKRRKSDGVLVYYSGMPFCTDLAGDSGGETSPTTYMTSTNQTQDSVDEVLQGRPTIHRSSSGSLIPFRPLTDYLSLSREEWAGLGLLGIGTVGRGNGTGALGGGAIKNAGSGDNMSSSASYSTASNEDAPDNEILFMEHVPPGYFKGLRLRDGSSSPVSSSYLGGGSGGGRTDITTIESREPHLEASGLSGVMPDDHFNVRVTTQRPFQTANAIEYDDDLDTDAEGDVLSGITSSHGNSQSQSHSSSAGVFSMSSLARRVAALKKQTAPISAAVPTFQPQGTHPPTPPVVAQYLSVVYGQREPVKLPQPAMFYPPFSQSSESEESSDMLDDDANMDDENSSMFASSSVMSRRANPHHSVKHSVNQSVNQSVDQSVNPSMINASEMMSSGEDGDIEAGESGEMEDSM